MWTVQRQERAKGFYYSAIEKNGAGKRLRCITVGYLDGDPEPAGVLARLRLAEDGIDVVTDDVAKRICRASDGEVANIIEEIDAAQQAADDAARMEHATSAWQTSTWQTSAAPAIPKAAPAVEPAHPKAAMTLATYLEEVWAPIRRKQPGTWPHEEWLWERRIIPALGDVRLCDLDTAKWNTFLKGLTCGGRSKALTQTAYRCALRHAATPPEKDCKGGLGWLPGLHGFDKITGSTKRTLAEAEPLTSAEEVATFLSAAGSPMHRAMFAVQVGNGLRPHEVILVRWEDVNWTTRGILVRGTKNPLAWATVGLTPLSFEELHAYWTAQGKPTSGAAFTQIRGEQKGQPFTKYPRTAFRTAAKNSGLNDSRTRGLYPYVCRHSFATLAAESGIDRAHTKKMMRHSKASTVMDDAYIKVDARATAQAFANFGVVAAAK